MNTQRKESSEGAKAHNDKANIASNVKYFKIVHEMNQKDAQSEVKSIIEKGGDLLSNAECNAAISRYNNDAARRESQRVEQEAQEKAEQNRREQEERAKETYAKRKAEKEQAEKREAKKPKDIDEESALFVANMIEKGNTIPQIRGYLLFKGFSLKDIKAYIETLDLKTAKKRVLGEREKFMQRFISGPMSEEDFAIFIERSSPNVQKHESVYRAMFNTFNAIHAKYSN